MDRAGGCRWWMGSLPGGIKALWMGLAGGSVIRWEERRRAFHRSTSYIEFNEPQAQGYTENRNVTRRDPLRGSHCNPVPSRDHHPTSQIQPEGYYFRRGKQTRLVTPCGSHR